MCRGESEKWKENIRAGVSVLHDLIVAEGNKKSDPSRGQF